MLEELCRPIGGVKNIHVFLIKGGAEYMCVVELDSPNLNASIVEKLGGIHFGNGVVFRVPNSTAAIHHRYAPAGERPPSDLPSDPADEGG